MSSSWNLSKVEGKDDSLRIFLFDPVKYFFFVTRRKSFLTWFDTKVVIGVTRLSLFNGSSKMALILEGCATALIVTLCLWPVITSSSSIFPITDQMTSNTVDQTSPACISTSHISTASITFF